ncbi:MAG: response regulator [Deltaproteobacteria bacterium]|nr:response regulator [Deltaproteobacteria bacterium]
MSKLFIINGPDKGKIFNFSGNIAYVGRLPDNDIQIRDKTISRKHLRIQRRGEKFTIRDLNSKNGTLVNGKLLKPGTDLLVDAGVPIAVGKVFISLGVMCSEELLSNYEMETFAEEFSNTAVYTAYHDRPLTQPKNMDFFFKVANVLNQSLDINIIMEKMLDYIFDLLKRIDRGVIILTDSETGEFSSVITRSERSAEYGEGESKQPLYSKTVVNAVIRNGKPVTILDAYGQEEMDVSKSMELMKVRSVMCVPLISKSKIRGVIYVDSVRIPYGFREEDIALITALCSPAAIAIENAMLYSNMERLVNERTNKLRETEASLKENEKRFRAMFNNMSSGVLVCKAVNNGDDFIVKDLNKAECKIDRIKRNIVLNQSLLDALPELKNTVLPESLKRVWQTNRPERCSITLSRDEKTSSWREYYIDTLPGDEIMAIFDDVTDKIKHETEQKALQEQLFAAQKMESIGQFAGGTAHNFRNILQAISGNIEYLELIYGEEPEIKELSTNIYNSIERGVSLINNLLHFAKKDWKVEMEDIDLSDVIKKTYEIIKRVFNKNIEINLDLEKDLWVKGNSSLLSQAFMNLFTNARDAMPKGGELSIKAKKVKNSVIAFVSDTGHGIEKEVIDKIFDPFFTLKEVGSGTGLGLSTTLGIVEQHKGSITVSSKPDKGATFKITMPLSEEQASQADKVKDDIIYGNKQKILIIDDEIIVLESMASLLEQMGYKAIPVNRSEQAMDSFLKYSPDLVLIDRNMPGLDGVACIREFMNADPDAKIVIISGYENSGHDGIEEDVKGMIKGYLVKPCGAAELSRMISQVLGN